MFRGQRPGQSSLSAIDAFSRETLWHHAAAVCDICPSMSTTSWANFERWGNPNFQLSPLVVRCRRWRLTQSVGDRFRCPFC